MLIDGEKYACEACVRGHRVSNCNHYERPLQHINKKGRPVSQCPHCRGLRKARSSHVKCECGDKVRKSGSVSPTKRCACGQGARCTCALKKEHLMPYEEIKKVGGLHRSRSHTEAHKPRLSPMYQDPSLTVFQNGHHKPVHHRNLAGHERGLPYKVPSRPHSIHGHSSMANGSTDSLPLLSDYSYPYEFIVSSEDMVHSAHNSPALKPKVDLLNQLPQLDLSYGALNTDISSVTSSPQPEEFQPQQPAYRSTYFSNVEQSTPLSAMSGGGPVDLSALGLQAFGNDYSQSSAYSGLDPQRLGTPEISDTEDYPQVNSPAFYADSPYLGPQDAAAVMNSYNVNVSSDPMGAGLTPPSSMPNSSGLTGMSMGSLGAGVGSPIPSIPQLSPDLEENYHYSLEAQKMAQHPAISRESSMVPSSPPQPFRPTSDPTWGHFPDEQAFLPSNDGVYQSQPTWSH